MNWYYLLSGLIIGLIPGIMIILYEEYKNRIKQ